MAPVQLDTAHYNARMSLIYDAWSSASDFEEYNSMSNLDALFLMSGDHAEDEVPRKTSAVQTWLFGYEFPSTFILMQKNKVTFLCSGTKAKILEPIRTSQPNIPVEILVLPKAKDAAAANAQDVMKAFVGLLSSAQRVGTLSKEEHSGKVINDYKAALSASGHTFETVDIAVALGAAMVIKDEEELKIIRTTSNLCNTLLSEYVVPKLESIIDKEKPTPHATLVSLIEHRLGDNERPADMKLWSKGRNLTDVDFPSVEFVYVPQIQSAGSGFNLKLSSEPSSANIAFKGVHITSIGLKYKGYCANVSRTYIVDPTSPQEALYGLVVEIHKEVIAKLKEGAVARDVYNHALSIVKQKRPELEGNFLKNIGHAMGLEFKESAYVLSAKNGRVLRTNMVFNLTIGFQDVKDEKGPAYTVHIADTVKIGQERGVCLTDVARDAKECMFFFQNEEEVKPKPKAPKQESPKKSKIVGGKALRTATRSGGGAEVAQNVRTKIYPHQVELHAKRQADGLARYESGGGAGTGAETKSWKRFISYKGEAALPAECSEPKIYIDKKALTVVLPIHGYAVPFHINTIKNVSKNDEAEYVYLRINFQTPGQLTGKKEDTPFEDPEATFIRSLTYRSLNRMRFDTLFASIQQLKKDVNKREQQKKEMADVVEQDRLEELKGKPQRLPDVFPRPALDGKRLPGDVEIHHNGLRYTSMGNQRVDVLFSNIKHLFFQPCDNELIVLIHCHLKAPIMIGKKKTKDVQFYREATDMQFDETGNRKRKHRYGDEDEIEMEQQERKRRAQLNREFKAFAEKIAEAATEFLGEPLELDIPYGELSFEGVPFRTNVKLAPTMDCLVYLTDPPFLVVTLSEIEMASLERVQFGLKQFDMVFVFRDLTRAPLSINSIPSSQLNNVMEWLNDVDVPIAESQINLNWGPIMKTINEDPAEFFAGGGWGFLGIPGQPADEDSEQSEEESSYDQSSEESEEEDSGSDFDDSDASDDDDEDMSGDDSGGDWDEMEAKAAKSDKRKADKGRGRGSDSDVPKKKKASGGKSGR
ncbi:probable SPT16-general chromatin factor (Subunit of the heterodimeric FACT complex) [Serendipita indica DSM 11827]|uniref:FACT complex subunit n=1 Tax=Serendipita indica (strain DSM 11827) TaxID=1109443 RepID=G4TE41_SERID|nr:probable SPT16-general chromatin factor (Subunit of the heterodimeric FACT complex) [Serendipita indica DSM 11827]